MCPCCFMKRTAPCSSIPNLCFSRNLKAIQKSGFFICLLIQRGKFPLLPELPLTMAFPSTLGQIYERVHIIEKSRAEPFITPCSSISNLSNLCFSRKFKAVQKSGFLICLLIQGANFQCFLSYPLQWRSPAL